MQPGLTSLHHRVDMGAKAEVSVPGDAQETRPFVERDRDGIAAAIGKRDARMSIGLPSHVWREEGDVALAWFDVQTLP